MLTLTLRSASSQACNSASVMSGSAATRARRASSCSASFGLGLPPDGRALPSSVSLFDLKVRFFVPILRSRRRAEERSRLVVASTLRHAPPLPGYTLTASSTMAPLGAVKDDDQRGAP
jgi:hypothetical protein